MRTIFLGLDSHFLLKSLAIVFFLIFLKARGPAFKSNKVLKPFENVNVYSLMCKILEIKCEPNNGTVEVFQDILFSNANLKLPILKLIILIIFINKIF